MIIKDIEKYLISFKILNAKNMGNFKDNKNDLSYICLLFR